MIVAQISLLVAWAAWWVLMLASLIWLAWCLSDPDDE